MTTTSNSMNTLIKVNNRNMRAINNLQRGVSKANLDTNLSKSDESEIEWY